jgi:type IV pilus assembly protein PilQ
MDKPKFLKLASGFGILVFVFYLTVFAQDKNQDVQVTNLDGTPVLADSTENVTLDFKDADIQNVLRIISYKSGVNIVTTPDVIGNVTIRLVDVPWDKALDVVLQTYGFGYEKKGNIITVAPISKLTDMKKAEADLAQVQPTVTEVFTLKYVDALDAKKAIEPQLSPRGKITVLQMTGQAGWEFATTSKGEGMAKRKRGAEESTSRSKVLIVSDVPPVLDKIREVVAQIDVMPKQVLIETRIMEVSRDHLRDIGFDWGTGTSGASSTTISTVTTGKNSTSTGTAASEKAGGNILTSQVKPATFNPIATGISGVYPYNMGLSLLFQKLSGTQFSAMLHALEEDVNTNTLSAPKIMALNNQEATILVGTKYPILKTDNTGAGSTAVTTVTLDYYQDIGIQLNVVPQVGANDYINMVVHPAVTSYTTTLGSNAYPIIETREAETRILMKDGETIVLGGLLKDVKNKGVEGIPFLRDLPYVGVLFKRDTVDFSKIDLLIFISARIVKEGETTPEQMVQLQDSMTTIDKFGALERDKMVKKERKKDRELKQNLEKARKEEGTP